MQEATESNPTSVAIPFSNDRSTAVLMVPPCISPNCDCDICLRQRIATAGLREKFLAELAELEGK